MRQKLLEKLRFTLTVENLSRADQNNPILYCGVNEITRDKQFELSPGTNDVIVEGCVYEPGNQKLTMEVKETSEAWNTGGFIIRDLKIHGIGVGLALFQCVYFPKYDEEFYAKNKAVLTDKVISGLHIGNRGRWEWQFESPIYNNAIYKIGLW
tara:strand:- start:974 stop:1432 length:459 start_codon:yes stop_codon:yes gene_type:complete